MDEDYDMTDLITKFNDKINSFSIGKRIFILGLLFAILGALFYMSTIDKYETINYMRHDTIVCTENYVNGELNGSSCEEYYPNQEWKINKQFEIFRNMTSTQNQS